MCACACTLHIYVFLFQFQSEYDKPKIIAPKISLLVEHTCFLISIIGIMCYNVRIRFRCFIKFGYPFYSSVAIMCYIATKYKVQDHWFPRQDVQQAARLDEFLNWQHLCLFKPMRDLVVEMVS